MRFTLFLPSIFLFGAFVQLRAAAPPNDAFANSLPLIGTNLTVTASNVGASKEPGEPDPGANAGGKSVWWTWQAPAAGSVIIQTKGSTFDTTLGAYTGAMVSELTVIASNDDAPGLASSVIGFDVSAGTVYHLAVDGYDGASGQVSLTLSYSGTPLTRPANDDFGNRISLAGVHIETVGTNLFASVEPGEPQHAGVPGGASIWWTWTAPETADVTVDTEGSNVDTSLGVYTGSSVGSLTVVTANDDISDNNPTSRATLHAVSGTAYQIAVDGYDGEPGQIDLEIVELPWLNAPKPLAGGGYAVTISGVTGKMYTLETSADLRTWQTLTTVTNVNGTVNVNDSSSGIAYRFYRARQVP